MTALILLITRTVTVLLALPLATLLIQLTLLRDGTDGDAGLVVVGPLLSLTAVLVGIALFFNRRYLQPKPPVPRWLRSRIVRIELRVLVLAVIGTVLANNWS
jgi:hypothetical protein